MSQIERNQNSDTLLLQQVEQASNQAFNLLFEKYWEKAFSDAYKRIKDGVAKLPDRTSFSGSVATTDRLVRTMVNMAGVPLTVRHDEWKGYLVA